MFLFLLIFFCSLSITNGKHFNGGTITWTPVNPYDNSSSVEVTITQAYAWAYPTITCATNVPSSTSGRSTQYTNLTCVADCTTDGGYSTKLINTLTDCTSISTSLGMINSERSHNISLTAGAHFYLANVGSAWVPLNYPAQSGLQWSIVTFIDLRMRPDGFINTPPVASVVSPQYAIVNRTVQINIPVSDVNAGDDVRCRWSTYTAGSRRRKRSDNEGDINYEDSARKYKTISEYGEVKHIRKKRSTPNCTSSCAHYCPCNASVCIGTTCNGTQCGIYNSKGGCTPIVTGGTTTVVSTTIDTPGTIKSTSSYPTQQAIDECGDICYPGSVPNSTTLANCVITFTGLQAGAWYAVAIQVEDFINDTSTIPMSSVPVQLLIYVMPEPDCPTPPIILPLYRCLEVQVGVSISFDLYALCLCDPNIAGIGDIVVSSGITGMVASNLIDSPTNDSLSYITFTWTPQANQNGSQQMCTIAYTDEEVQSLLYCITFTVKTSSDLCVTTTTTSTTTTTTSVTTTTTTTSTTCTSTSTSTTTSSTSTSSTSTTSTTSTSTSTSTTSTSTSTTTSSTSTSSTSTTSTTTTSTSTTTTETSATTATTTTATTATTTKPPASPINWPLILGLSLLALLMALCVSCCCLYRFCWGPAAQRSRRKQTEADVKENAFEPRNICDILRQTRVGKRIFGRSRLSKDYLTDNELHPKGNMNPASRSHSHIRLSGLTSPVPVKILQDVEKNRSGSIVSVKRIKCINARKVNDIEETDEIKDTQIQRTNHHHEDRESSSVIRQPPITVHRVSRVSTKLDEKNEIQTINNPCVPDQDILKSLRSKTGRISVKKVSRTKTADIHGPLRTSVGSNNIINVQRPSISIQSTADPSITASVVTDNKTNKGNGVTVTKIPRTLSFIQSHR